MTLLVKNIALGNGLTLAEGTVRIIAILAQKRLAENLEDPPLEWQLHFSYGLFGSDGKIVGDDCSVTLPYDLTVEPLRQAYEWLKRERYPKAKDD